MKQNTRATGGSHTTKAQQELKLGYISFYCWISIMGILDLCNFNVWIHWGVLILVLFVLGGRKTVVLVNNNAPNGPFIRKGDVVGCALDLTVPMIRFTFNGVPINGCFTNFNLEGMFFPVISCSSKLRWIANTIQIISEIRYNIYYYFILTWLSL